MLSHGHSELFSLIATFLLVTTFQYDMKEKLSGGLKKPNQEICFSNFIGLMNNC